MRGPICSAWSSVPPRTGLLFPDPLSFPHPSPVHLAPSFILLISQQLYFFNKYDCRWLACPHCALVGTLCVRQHGAGLYTHVPNLCPPSPTSCWRDTPLSHTRVAWRDMPCQLPSSLSDGPSSSSKAWQCLHLIEHLACQRALPHDMSKIINIMAQGYQIAIQAIYSGFFCLSETSGFKPSNLGHQVCFASLKPLICT